MLRPRARAARSGGIGISCYLRLYCLRPPATLTRSAREDVKSDCRLSLPASQFRPSMVEPRVTPSLALRVSMGNASLGLPAFDDTPITIGLQVVNPLDTPRRPVDFDLHRPGFVSQSRQDSR